jgi:type IV pilus assembly protein PilC
MKYKYVLERHGERVEGTETANSKAELFDKIKQTGDVLILVEEIRGGTGLNINVDDFFAKFSRIKAEEKILFAKNISSMIESGLSMSRALSVIKRQSRNKKFKDIITDIEKDISTGNTFSSALARHPGVFSEIFVAMSRAGEESGQLTGALRIVSDQLERSNTLKKKIRGAMMYPSVIIVAMLLIAILMLIYVVPSLTATFRDLDIELPGSTMFIIFVSDLLQHNAPLVFGGLIALGVGVAFGLRQKQGKRIFNSVMLKLPVISGLVKESNSATTARTLSSLLSSGVEVVQALEITRDVIQNHHYQSVLDKAKEAISKGRPLSSVFVDNAHLYPVFVGEMIAVGEETGKLSTMLENVAKYYEEEVQQKTKDLSTIVEPVLMVIVGAAVGFFAVSMITPMYSIANKI